MQARLAIVLEPRVDLDLLRFQQELDDPGAPEFAGPGESVLHLLLGYCRLEAAVPVKKALHDVQSPDAGRTFQIQPRTANREKLGCLPAAVMETAIDGAPAIRTVDDGA